MSELKEQIETKIKAAMKARQKDVLLTLRGLSAAIKQYEVDSRKDADDGQVLTILQKEVKKCKDALPYAEQQGRQDLIEQNKNEIALLQEFMGKQLSEDELKNIIQELLAGGADSIGAVMGALNKDHKGTFDGKTASQIARELLE